MFATRDNSRLAAELAAGRSRISELEAELVRAASRDPISADLLNLRSFRAQLELDVQRAERYGGPLAAALIDIDRFRQFNLKHGYAAGDLVLAGVGTVIATSSRANDLACRLGGDEFALLFPETEHRGAFDAVGRILVSLESLEAGGVRGHSASAGIAMLEPGQTPEALLAAASSALETARAGGGGQAAVFSTAAEGAGRTRWPARTAT